MTTRYDVAVIGAGVFGAWTAWHLGRRGERLFHETGVLWLAGKDDSRVRQAAEVLARCGVAFEELSRKELEKRYPQIGLEGITKGLLELHSGVLMARRAVAVVAETAQRLGVEYRVAQIAEPRGSGAISAVTTNSGERIEADTFVFACGAWLGKIFPEILGARIFPSRQEVFFFGVPAGDARFAPPALPTWLFQEDEIYGMPDLEGRGLKIAVDRHGERVDPDTQSRLASAEGAAEARRFVEQRFPALRGAPIVETRVCQYENTWNGDFLIDRHPEIENVWLVGGGSGHGFKHGPAVGEYVAGRILGGAVEEPRFSLASKETVQRRAVF